MTLRRMGLLALIVGLASAVVLVFARSKAPGLYEEAVRHARTIVETYVETTGVPALQVAVAVDGRIVWSEAFGRADLSVGRPATAQSRFRIASVSKLLTGTLTAKLADDGVLDLDRPIGEYVPDLPAAWHEITARMLVHHTSGISHYTDRQDALDTTYYATTRAALAWFRDRPLVHRPGERETYSSYAFTVLALTIEQVTGRPFLDVMQEEILQPLGMTHTGPDLQSSPPPDRTGFYEFAEDGSIQEAPHLDLSGRWAGSGYLSTAEDLVRFGVAHTEPGLLSAGALELVAQRQTLPDGSTTLEGFAWGPRSDWDGRRMLWGDGSTPGSRGGLLVYPEDGISLAILTNARGMALDRGEFQTLARLFFAARAGRSLQPMLAWAVGRWSGSVAVGEGSLEVQLEIEDVLPSVRGRVAFEGWRSLAVADAFQLGDTTWLVPLDRQGFFPLTLVLAGDSINATAPRADLSFRLTRSAESLDLEH